MNALYYECHITIAPVFEERLQHLTEISAPLRFKPAKLFMQKGDPSNLDTFVTGHDTEVGELECRMVHLIGALIEEGYQVYRYKIEAVLLDSKHGYDKYGFCS